MNTIKSKENTNNSQNNLSFAKEVAMYFMNFLETDFKKRRIPKRNAIQKTQKGLKVGIDLEKYPKLKKTFFMLLNSGFKKESLQIKKGEQRELEWDLFSAEAEEGTIFIGRKEELKNSFQSDNYFSCFVFRNGVFGNDTINEKRKYGLSFLKKE